MDPFSYLTVLISIILGLGITQLLGGFGRLLNVRARVRWYAPAVAWAAMLLLIHVQTWWAMFELRYHSTWSFPVFGVVLLLPILLFLMSALALPDAGGEGLIDMKASYYAHAGWFFGLGMAVIVSSMVRPVVLGDGFDLDADHAIQMVFFVGSAGAAFSRNERFHRWLTATFAALILFYDLVLFGRLR